MARTAGVELLCGKNPALDPGAGVTDRGRLKGMRILLAGPHRYPVSGANSSGLHPRAFPSGSGYHLHDLLAKGLAEEGHEVFYHLPRGVDAPLPPGVAAVAAPVPGADIYHAPIGGDDVAERTAEFAVRERRPCLLTCHMKET